jgi:hypothetical protein
VAAATAERFMTVLARALVGRIARTSAYLAVALLALLAVARIALACVAPAEPDDAHHLPLRRKQIGSGNHRPRRLESQGPGDPRRKNASKATGKISYAVYGDPSCKELVTKAGEFEFTGGKGGDSMDAESTSGCGSEILTVKAATSIASTLSAEEEELIEGTELTVFEGTGVKAKGTLSGTRSTTATGKVKYAIYADSKCEKLVTGAGEVTVEGGKVPYSEEVELGTYYWQVTYEGDSLHRASQHQLYSSDLPIFKFHDGDHFGGPGAQVAVRRMHVGRPSRDSEDEWVLLPSLRQQTLQDRRLHRGRGNRTDRVCQCR